VSLQVEGDLVSDLEGVIRRMAINYLDITPTFVKISDPANERQRILPLKAYFSFPPNPVDRYCGTPYE